MRLHAFLKCVAEVASDVESAVFWSCCWMGSLGIYPAREDRIIFEVLEPLLACPNLV
jgi:hypothetical protein